MDYNFDGLTNLNGTLDKQNRETYATIYVTKQSASDFYDKNTLIASYHKFLLQAVTVNEYTKFQVLETSAKPFMFFFGKKVVPVMFSGILIQRSDKMTSTISVGSDSSIENKTEVILNGYNWEKEFRSFYDSYLKMDVCLENNNILWITYQDVIIKGYMLNNTLSYNAATPQSVNLSFQFMPTGFINVYSDGAI